MRVYVSLQNSHAILEMTFDRGCVPIPSQSPDPPALIYFVPTRSADGRSVLGVNGDAMIKSLLCVALTAVFLATAAQAQQSTPSGGTPSVTDAAHAGRERQKSTKPKHVITDDDIAPQIGSTDAADLGASEQDVRAEMEKNYSSPLTKADMTMQITQMQGVVARGDAGMLTSFKQSALAGYEGVEFPGKKEWEQSLSVVARRTVEEAGKGVTRLQAIVDGNQNAIAGRDSTALARMRETWINALLPYATWQHRARDLVEDGRTHAKAYATGNPVGAVEYRHEAVRRNEIAVAGVLSELNIPEDELKRTWGHYACDATQWPRDPQFPDIPNQIWANYMRTVRGAGYRLEIQGCDRGVYTAVAVPPASDGSQGRAFCTDETGVVRVAADGDPATCPSSGRDLDKR